MSPASGNLSSRSNFSARSPLWPRRLLALAALLAWAGGLPAGQAEPLAGAHGDTVAITGATVHTAGRAGTIENATVLIAAGRIRAVGKDVPVPAGARRIDAHGKVVTPGLFDSFTALGIIEVAQEKPTNDTSVSDDHLSAAFDVADAYNPSSMLIPITRVEGITRVLVTPQPGRSFLAGQAAIVHLGDGSDFMLRQRAAVVAYLGETGGGLAGGSRAAAVLKLREALGDARDYAANRLAFERNQRRAYTLSRADLEALVPVVRGERPLIVAVDRASDILIALRLAAELHFRLVLANAAEAWKVAPAIASAHVPVLINPMTDLPSSFDQLGATLENAARLHRAGVTFAFITGDAHNVRNLKQGAGNAVANGLPWDAALAAMTINPARIWGLAEHCGSLEPGKDADLVVWDGDPLELTTFANHVFIRGVEVPQDSRQIRLRNRYLSSNGETPPVYRRP